MKNILSECTLCPHKCKVNRLDGELGRCKAGKEIKYNLAMLYYNEEPCISGEKGSGNIFFSCCNMNCVYCQNYKISQLRNGNEITIEELAELFLNLQNKGANNINLVTATMYVPQIIESIKIAKKLGLKIPIVYNCGGYESVETIKMLNGYVDIYLPDFKYYNNDTAFKYSKIKNYFENASESIKEMYKQVGEPIIDENGIMKKGVIIRNLILPGKTEESKLILKWIKDNFENNVYVSLMAQYFPCYEAKKYDEINRKITQKELNEVENYLFELDITNGYIQDLEEQEEQYVPKFND